MPQITASTIFIWTFLIEHFSLKFVFLFDNNQFQYIWAVKYANMSFTLEILENNVKISLQCLNKSLKKMLFAFNFLTCYGKQTFFFFALFLKKIDRSKFQLFPLRAIQPFFVLFFVCLMYMYNDSIIGQYSEWYKIVFIVASRSTVHKSIDIVLIICWWDFPSKSNRNVYPRLTEPIFVTQLTKGLVTWPSSDFQNKPPFDIFIVVPMVSL